MAVTQPSIVWKGAAPENFTKGHGGYAWEFLVLHIMQGSIESAANWFANPAARASTHFGVGKDGRIWQFVSLDDTAYAHGIVEVTYDAAPSVLKENWGASPNQIGVGIEHEGMSGEAMTDAQFVASTRLAAWLFQDYLLKGGASGVAVDRGHVLRHGEISPKTRAGCPGFTEPFFDRYIARVKELLQPSPMPAPAREPSLAEVQWGLTSKIYEQDWAGIIRDVTKIVNA